MSSEFGTTAWGRDWLRLAEPTSTARPDPALPRARALARTDRVGNVRLDAGSVEAVVDDRGQHQVRVVLPTWKRTEQAAARAVLATNTGAGEDLPDSIHAALRDAGVRLAPRPEALGTTCTCPSRTRPCLHLLATFYEVSRRLDERPHLALLLHGLTGRSAPGDNSRIPLTLLDPADFYGPILPTGGTT